MDLEQPSPTYTQFSNALNLTIAANETTGRQLVFQTCAVPVVQNLPAGFSVDFFSMQTITTTQPSYIGAVVGPYYDPLVPYDPASASCLSGYVFADIAVAKGTAPGAYAFPDQRSVRARHRQHLHDA